MPPHTQQVRGRTAQRASSPIMVGLVYGAIGLLAVAVGIAAQRSIEEGRPVDLSELGL